MLELFDVSYEELKVTYSNEVYRLRKKTFSDRLGWDVVCNLDMEFDEFDNHNTRYIIGLYNGQLICSVRFTRLEQPNMITHTFHACFDTVQLPLAGIESSRFFVDKGRARQLHGGRYPLSRVLFLAMINWARHNECQGIHTIVSRSMLTILKRSGWKVKTLKEAFLSERERIFLVFLPTEVHDQDQMASGLISELGYSAASAVTWPLTLPV
ncbi:acyl-homoserine-lactone synthase [Serratia fonticola]|uniref:Acyl-homoserine-lactone synthase n=1 Tax=Serratia fonticola TaxID=47917 RepID=A0AAW3WVH4_SERFO|nr:acyl-homoserine-lactone synthase [Serratia fonticola]MBC3214786.1 acyl-homoserine-lactone synthase [Serratia fonticola]NYA15821.1 acyl-homoserine-lactone synthase [Serratia fonticola]NYA35707.1 acyl-homoserine-lactone synthase [Serratia fonticola]